MTDRSDLNLLQLHLCVPSLSLCDPSANLNTIIDLLPGSAVRQGLPQLYLFPELCLTGKTCGDLFFQPLLLEAAEHALQVLERTCQEEQLFAVLGLPLRLDGLLFNAAALLSPRGLLRFCLQSQPSSQGLERWFHPGSDFSKLNVKWHEKTVPVSADGSFHEPSLSEHLIQIVPGDPAAARLNPHASLILNPGAQIATAPRQPQSPWLCSILKTLPPLRLPAHPGPGNRVQTRFTAVWRLPVRLVKFCAKPGH